VAVVSAGAICRSAPRSREITTPAPHHLVFLQAGCLSCRPTNSVKALKAAHEIKNKFLNSELDEQMIVCDLICETVEFVLNK